MKKLNISFETEDTGNISMALVNETLKKAGFKNPRCYSIEVNHEGEES